MYALQVTVSKLSHPVIYNHTRESPPQAELATEDGPLTTASKDFRPFRINTFMFLIS